MFLAERLFGIACYSVVLFLFFFVIYYKKMQVKHALVFYVLILALFAYFFEPYKTADLYRISKSVEVFSQYTFKSFAKIHLTDNSTPVAYFLYWLVGQTGNARLLPMFAAIITYSIIFYILYKSSEIYSSDSKVVATVLFFVMSTGNFMMVISGIRTMLAISVLCFCFFRESVLKSFKAWHILLYIVAAFTHNLALILIVIRCIALVVSARLKPTTKLTAIIFFVLLGLYSWIEFDWLFDSVFEKAYGYITGDTYSYLWEYIIGVAALVIEIITLRTYKKSFDLTLRENRMYLLLCAVLACIFATQFSIFHRLVTYIAPILTIPLLVNVFTVSRRSYELTRTVFWLSFFMLIVACTRGELSSLKFFAF